MNLDILTRRATLQTLLCGTAGWATGLQAASPRAPELTLRASDGHAVLTDGTGGGRWRATYIDFWASWCAPCKLSFAWMNEMHAQLAASGLRIVAIGVDRKDSDAQRFLKQTPARFAIALDPAGESALALGVQAMPSSYIVGSDRRLLYTHRGFREDDTAALEARLRAAIA
jgi:cytochrome c biogenesis protein CcmG, thiol:disulfide interchange protein DsbE